MVSGSLLTSDIYSVEDDTWRPGPNVPGPVQNFEGLAYDEHSFLIRLRADKTLYKVNGHYLLLLTFNSQICNAFL